MESKEKNKKTISACMIVKDEADVIEDCIATICNWVDEIILVDTGSTDDTVNMAVKAGAGKVKVFEYEWDDDFSAARNFSMSKATMDWIFIIDADERINPVDGDILVKMLPTVKQQIIAVTVDNYYMDKKSGRRVPRSTLAQLRFFLRENNPKYSGRVHNKPVINDDVGVLRIPFKIIHHGYDLSDEKKELKFNRAVRMCRKLTIDEPKDPVSWYHLAQALRVKNGAFNTEDKDEMVKAIEFGIAAGNGKPDHQNVKIQLFNLGGWIHYHADESIKAVEMGKQALALKPDYLDAIYLLAVAYTYGVDLFRGEKYFKLYLQEQESYDFNGGVDSITMMHANSRKEAYLGLADIEEHKLSPNTVTV